MLSKKYISMKKRLFFSAAIAVVAASITAQSVPAGAINGRFSVANGKQVYFAQGNLQYQASSNTWRFANEQTDTIGLGNQNTSIDYTGYIDVFGWGTGSNPTKVSEEDNYSVFTEWGNNPISNGGNAAKLWRTLTKDELGYLLYGRADSSELFATATVNGIHGLIILPDIWRLPDGCTFVPSLNKGLVWNEKNKIFANENRDNYVHNVYTSAQWASMQANGAVFLPASGYRYDADMYDTQYAGYYWFSTKADNTYCYALYFDPEQIYPQYVEMPCAAFSVRLVQEVSGATATNEVQMVSVQPHKQVEGSQVVIIRNGVKYNLLGSVVE